VNFKIKRIYDAAESNDGYRVLVDRLWPRGVSKEKAALDEWLKNIAPSPQLRQWFDHKADRFEEFKVRYELELQTNPAVKQLLGMAAQQKTTTLLYAARDPAYNHAIVLLHFLTLQA
jgi:uncharacterized protein YeaO (DUF488 family)